MERGAQKSVQSRLKNDSTKYAQKLHMHLEKLTAEGHPDPWRESARRALAACGEESPRDSGKHTGDTSTTGKPSKFPKPCVAVLCDPIDPDWGTDILGYRVMAASGKSLTPRRQQVLVNQDSVQQAKDWHGSFKPVSYTHLTLPTKA